MNTFKIKDSFTISREKWQQYVDRHQYGSIFLTPFMYDVFAETLGYLPFALFAVSDDGSIAAMLLGYVHQVFKVKLGRLNKRIVLMSAPLANSSEALDCLLANYKKRFSRLGIYTEVRNHYNTGDYSEIFLKHEYRYEEHLNILIDLRPDIAILWNEMSSNRKKEVKKSIKEQLNFKQVPEKEFKEFYTILKDVYKRAKKPLVDYSFFRSLLKQNALNCYLLGVYEQSTLIGAVLLLKYKRRVYSLYGASKTAYYKLRPNDFLFWNVLLWAKHNGFDTFDWLGAGNPHKPYGVRDWKKQFGGIMVNYGRYIYVSCPLLMKIAEFGFSLLQNIKYKK